MTEEKKQPLPSPQNSKPKEPLYTVEELTKAAEPAFGVKPEVLAGSLNGFDKAQFTKSEVQKAIQKFLKKKV